MKHTRTRFLITVTTLLLVSSIILTGCGMISAETVTQTKTTTVQGASATETITQTETINGPVMGSGITVDVLHPFEEYWHSESNNTRSYENTSDKMVVIEYLSCSLEVEHSPYGYLLIQSNVPTESGVAYGGSLKFIPDEMETILWTNYFISEMVNIYIEPGEEITLTFHHAGSIRGFSYYMSGYFIDIT